jgi:hypothetical protein
MPTILLHAPPQRSSSCHRSGRHAITIFVFFLAASICLQAQTTTQVSIIGPTQVRLGGNAQYSATVGGVSTPVAWSARPVADSPMFLPAWKP